MADIPGWPTYPGTITDEQKEKAKNIVDGVRQSGKSHTKEEIEEALGIIAGVVFFPFELPVLLFAWWIAAGMIENGG